MAGRICIRDVAWLVAWNGTGHRYLRGADIVFEEDRIVHVGRRYDGPAGTEVDGRALMVMPGLVNVHCHPTNQPLYKGVREELGNPHLYGTGLYDFITLFAPDGAAKLAAAEYCYAELAQSGVTTVADLSMPYQGWVALAAHSGLRVVLSPMFRSARWRLRGGTALDWLWDEDGGRVSWQGARDVMDAAETHPSGRLSAMVSPGQIDTVTAVLLQESREEARAAGRPWQTHASQSVVEFLEITRRHDLTPVQWAQDLGLLGPGTSLGHAIFLDHHGWIHWPTRRDLDILAETGTGVAHCPTVFSRYGHTLQDFGRYRAAGVPMGIGTDTFPHNMLEEMRTAMILARAASGNMAALDTGAVFEAATVGGAAILGRDDLGRLAEGARADVVAVDLDHPLMRPVRDPLRSLVYTAAERAVKDVWVAGRPVVRDGRALHLDQDDAGRRLEEAQVRMAERVPERDERGRTLAEVSPLSLPLG